MTKKTADLANDTALSLAMMVLNIQKRVGGGEEGGGEVKVKGGRRERKEEGRERSGLGNKQLSQTKLIILSPPSLVPQNSLCSCVLSH